MTIGIVIGLLSLFAASRFFMRKAGKRNLWKRAETLHKAAGILIIILSVYHLAGVWELRKQRPESMYVYGFIMVFCAFAAMLSYLGRKKLKKNWLRIHKAAAAVLILCLAAHIFVGIKSLKDYQTAISNIVVSNVDMTDIKDGEYIGEYDAGYIYAKVKVTVKNRQILSVDILEHRTERGQAAEKVAGEMVERQQVKVDAVSGATNSSLVIMKAAENALKKEEA